MLLELLKNAARATAQQQLRGKTTGPVTVGIVSADAETSFKITDKVCCC